MDYTGIGADAMFGHIERLERAELAQKPIFTTRRNPSTRLARLASYVKHELRAISGDDMDKQQIAANALKGMF